MEVNDVRRAKVKKAMGELDEETVLDILNQVMSDGAADAMTAMEACNEGMNMVGDLFETGEYFVGDLVFAGEIMKEAVDVLRPALAGEGATVAGKMLMCTVEGDLHDIGKNIVISMLEAAGFEVVDLGIDVKPEKIVETVKDEDIKIVALSGVLTLALESMKKTVDALREAGLDQVKVIIGGAPVTAQACQEAGANAWATNPQETVKICRSWIEK